MNSKTTGTRKTPKYKIYTFALGQMQSNCYLLSDTSNNTLIIDPGDDADFITQKISDQGLIAKMIVATHGHFDHIMAVLALKMVFNIPFVIHENDLFLVKEMAINSYYFLNIKTGPVPTPDITINSRNLNLLADFDLKIIETPGHTPGSLCLYLKKQAALFSGDTYISNGVFGRTDFKYSSPRELHKSLKLIYQLPQDTTVYPGHGPAVTLGLNP